MKKLVLFLVLVLGVSFANANNNALGLWIGSYGSNNFGLDFKHLYGDNTALDIYLGDFRFGDQTAVGLGAGYYFLYPKVIKADASAGSFPLYWGPSLGFGYWSGGDRPNRYNGFDIGVNIVGGISWFTPTSFKMDVSLEVLTPSVGMWRESRENDGGNWNTKYDPALGLKGSLGLRLLFHAYFF